MPVSRVLQLQMYMTDHNGRIDYIDSAGV